MIVCENYAGNIIHSPVNCTKKFINLFMYLFVISDKKEVYKAYNKAFFGSGNAVHLHILYLHILNNLTLPRDLQKCYFMALGKYL